MYSIVVCVCVWQELKDRLNYGLFQAPVNGRAGKFLDEERPLRDYPLAGPFGMLEVYASFVIICC